MNAPNPFLCDVYGTSKTAGAAGKLVAGFLTHKMVQGEQDRQAQLRAEAEMMNRISRMLEERKMRSTLHGLSLGRGGVAPDTTNYGDMDWQEPALFNSGLYKGSSVKHVEDAARAMAHQGMDKEAIGAIAAMLPGIAKMLGGVGSKLLGAAAKGGGGVASQAMGRAGKAMTTGAGRLKGLAPTQAMKAVGPGGTQVMGAAAKGGGAVGPGGTQVMKSVAKTQPMKAMGPGGTQVMEAAPEIAKKAPGMLSRAGSRVAEGARQAGGRVAEGARSLGREAKHNLGFGFRAKAALGASALGLGYMGLKGMQATKDYMMQPSQSWGGHQPYGLRHNVSGFGGGYAY